MECVCETECVSSIEEKDKFQSDKSVHHFIRFFCPLQILLKGGIKLCKLVFR